MTNDLEQIKQMIVDYFNANHDAMNIEAMIDLDIDKPLWDIATKQLLDEGKLYVRTKHAFVMCKDKNGNITKKWL